LDERACAREDCNNNFEPKAHNGKYCSPECRKISTNAKVLQRYYDKKGLNSGKQKRVCHNKSCGTILSKYNKENICESCKTKRLKKRLKRWGWDDTQADRKIESLEF
jgi:hypothetical protein